MYSGVPLIRSQMSQINRAASIEKYAHPGQLFSSIDSCNVDIRILIMKMLENSLYEFIL